MSHTNKGGARLRLITAVTGVTAIAAGVFAMYGSAHRPLAACTLAHAALKAGNSVDITCSGLTSGHTYKFVNGSGQWTSLPSNLSVTNLTNGVSLSTSNTGSTTNDGYVVLEDMASPGVPVANSSTADIYVLNFSSSDSAPIEGDPAQLVVSGLLGGETLKVMPRNSSNAADSTGWQLGTGGSGTFGSPYKFGSSSPFEKDLSADITGGSVSVYMQLAANSISADQDFKYRAVIVIGGDTIEIGQSDLFTIQNQ